MRTTVKKTNPDYDLVIKSLHLCYDMKLVTFGIDTDKNLIVQFPVFIQLYTQQLLILYQIETVPVPSIDQNTQVQLYKSKYSCKSVNYFDLDSEIIKENCKFDFNYNKTDTTLTLLDDGNDIGLTISISYVT